MQRGAASLLLHPGASRRQSYALAYPICPRGARCRAPQPTHTLTRLCPHTLKPALHGLPALTRPWRPPARPATPPPPSTFQAKLAEQAERYDEMVSNMRELAKLNLELSVEERNLLSVGYKNLIGARRSSWRILTSIHTKEQAKGASEENIAVLEEYRGAIEKELEETYVPHSSPAVLLGFAFAHALRLTGPEWTIFILRQLRRDSCAAGR